MPTFKAIIRKDDRKQDGTWNVKIRVTQNRESVFISTPFYVDQSKITRGYKIKDAAIISQTEKKIAEYRDMIVEIGFGVEDMNVRQIVNALEKKQDNIDFMQYMFSYADNLQKTKRTNTASIYKTAAMSLYRFNGERPLYSQQINAQFFHKYFLSIQSLKSNTIRAYIICIRTMYKAAQLQYNDDDSGVINFKHGVFKLVTLPQQNDSERETLTVEQMQALIDTPYTGKWFYDFTKDMFILSFMCFGINAKDLFFMTKDQYQDGMLIYRRQKVVNKLGKEAEMKIKLSEPAKIILDKYSGDDKYLIDFGQHKRTIHVCRYIHGAFQNAGIEKEGDYLSKVGHKKGEYVFYTNRHTMASLARNECGIDYMTVHQMLNHATPNAFKTTDVYIQKNFSPLWEANEKLLDLFDWSFYLNQKTSCE